MSEHISGSDARIHDVSDTALWVAAYRAVESSRSDAAFHDPLAEVLVGERGHAIRQNMPGMELMQWVMVLRTTAIDRLIEHAIADGGDTVINLGAGLDTRPYRLNVPSTLRWIEVDFANIVALKNQRLQPHKPKCNLERIVLDVTQHDARQQLLAKVSDAKSIAVLSEGLLPYLEADVVASLADDLNNSGKVNYWVQDYYSGQLRNSYRPWRRHLQAAPFNFRQDDWIGFFTARGWHVKERILIADEARRLGRRPPFPWWRMLLFMLMPPQIRKRAQERAGYVMFAPVKQLTASSSLT